MFRQRLRLQIGMVKDLVSNYTYGTFLGLGAGELLLPYMHVPARLTQIKQRRQRRIEVHRLAGNPPSPSTTRRPGGGSPRMKPNLGELLLTRRGAGHALTFGRGADADRVGA